MGAGKSTVGKILSASIGYKFIDLDDLIEKTSNKKIADIFLNLGEEYFRNLETDCLTSVSKDKSNTVISTGGGIVLNPTNINIIESSGTSIYLKAGIETIWERIKEDKGRPLLEVENPFETACDLLESRKVLYESSEIVVETESLTPQMISDNISELLFT
jgi:shikimate kinase